MDAQALFAFAAAFFVFAASPGPDNMTIVARTVSNGAPSGFAYGLGTAAGILLYLGLAAFGLSIIASEMGMAMKVLRYAGAAYLIWMGIRLWTAEPVLPHIGGDSSRRNLLPIFLTGIALNLGNPKMPLFYLALLPNFVGVTFGMQEYFALSGVILAVEAVVIGGHFWMANRARHMLRTPAIIGKVNHVSGSILAGTGLAILVARRSA
ncbi:MAG: LysE family translocator [Allorhizobium sp.]